jgi:hypothetical protein
VCGYACVHEEFPRLKRPGVFLEGGMRFMIAPNRPRRIWRGHTAREPLKAGPPWAFRGFVFTPTLLGLVFEVDALQATARIPARRVLVPCPDPPAMSCALQVFNEPAIRLQICMSGCKYVCHPMDDDRYPFGHQPPALLSRPGLANKHRSCRLPRLMLAKERTVTSFGHQP